MSGDSGSSKKKKQDEPATPAPTISHPAFMPGMQSALAQQLAAGYGQNPSDLMAYLSSIHTPMNLPAPATPGTGGTGGTGGTTAGGTTGGTSGGGSGSSGHARFKELWPGEMQWVNEGNGRFTRMYGDKPFWSIDVNGNAPGKG